jgi:predicted acylesterase/phospholipase RssA
VYKSDICPDYWTLEVQDDKDLEKYSDDKDKEKFEQFRKSLYDDQNKPKITFGHLDLLRKIKPATFKDLYITAVSKKDKALKIFSSATKAHKNISIAEACRASSSLPLLFSPADINGEKYLDGGLKNNMPYDAFLDSKETQEILSKTLVCTLDEGGRKNVGLGECGQSKIIECRLYPQSPRTVVQKD